MKTYLIISTVLILIFTFIAMMGIYTANNSLNVGLLLSVILSVVNLVVVIRLKK